MCREYSMKRIARFSLLFAMSLFLNASYGFMVYAESGIPEEAAAAYSEQALLLLEAGLDKDAITLAEAALRYRPDYSDALAIIAYSLALENEQISISDSNMTSFGQSVEQQVDYLMRAVQGYGFILLSEAEARLSLAHLLIQTKRFEQAAQILPPITAGGLPEEQLYIAWIRIFIGQEKWADADSLLNEAIRLYPRSAELMELLLSRDPVPQFFTRAFLENALQPSRYYTDALLRLIESQSSYSTHLFEQYYALGGDSPRAPCIQLLRAGSLELEQDQIDAMYDRFVSFGGLERWDLLALLYHHDLPEYLLERLQNDTSELTGTLYWHQPYQLRPSYWIYVQQGRLQRAYLDTDSDGLVEFEVSFVEGLPSQFVEYGPEETRICMYHYYPWLVRCEIVAENQKDIFTFVPYQMELPLFEILPVRGIHSWANADFSTFNDMHMDNPLNHAGRIRQHERINANGESEYYWYRAGNIALSHMRDRTGSMYSVTQYQDNLPVRSSVSLQHDGYFDQVSVYENGQIVASAFDIDRDGQADLWESYGERSGQLWRIHTEPLFGILLHPSFSDCRQADIIDSNDELFTSLLEMFDF